MVSAFNLTPAQIVVIGAIIGLAFALPLTTDEEGVFANVLDLAVEMIFITAAQRILINDAQTTTRTETSAANIQQQIDELREKITKRSMKLKSQAAPSSR